MSVRKNKNLARRIHIFLLAGAMAFVTAAPVYAIPTNTQLPSGFESMLDNSTYDKAGNTGNIHQTGLTAVNKWSDFSIGADAVVNFTSDTANFNSVNFVNNGKVSEIYGQINANGGNIFLANTAGVQIGGSAQINVGSLYVTNKDLSSISSSLSTNSNMDTIKNSIANVKTTNAELMSLGGIVTEGNVTFDGDRVVIDVDHLYKNTDGDAMDTGTQLTIKTTDADNVVLGYTAYDENTKYNNENANKLIAITDSSNIKSDTGDYQVKGYMWVENLLQLQAMETKLDGNYALRNSIDANFSADANYNYSTGTGNGFNPIGDNANSFNGRFDGLGYDIFDLNIKRNNEDYVGLFGYINNATIRNFTLNSGSVAGGTNTGAAVGYAESSTISNIINTADVTGSENVGGLVGYAQNSTLDGLINTGTITGTKSNIGGIAGNITGSSITGETYNLGAVTGDNTTNTTNTTFNVGGIVGSADASTIGNKSENGEDVFVIYNELTVTGGYNVGGIAGQITGSDTNDGKTMVVQNVANEGAVEANGSDTEGYSYHTARTETQIKNDVTGTTYENGVATIDVKVANAGGIVGSANNASVSNAENSGDVTTAMTENNTTGDYYNAGNVGGIIGRAENTNITTVVNKENNVAGAHNVGGAVGYLTGNSQVDGAINNGGDITATGARRADGDTNINNGFAQESVRRDGSEKFNIGNIGGIVGYMYGDNTYIVDSANRGTVHSAYYESDVPIVAKAANVGGIVGKIDRNSTKTLEQITSADEQVRQQAAVSGSYNTGNVQGYTGIGGIAGFMYNGEVITSYNLGNISSTRVATSASTTEATNMGGIVGDSTEKTDARVLVYDVYNTGTIGDKSYDTYGRHLGGIVGRLSGQIEKAYNTGDIYNGSNVVGGIVGYWYAGKINNTFNTGNITVINNNTAQSQVGGIVGAADLSTSIGDNAMKLSNSYNLGTLRSFRLYSNVWDHKTQAYINTYGENKVGGIVGYLVNWDGTQEKELIIDGVYTLGNLYAATQNTDKNSYTSNGTAGIGAIVGGQDNAKFTIGDIGAFYIKPEANKGFSEITTTANGVKIINFSDRYAKASYKGFTDDDNGKYYSGFNFSSQNGDNVKINTGADWRIYNAVYDNDGNLILGTTPILNAFLPDSETFFGQSGNMEGISSIQYGTAFNPLLTIINASNDAVLNYNWSDLRISGAAGLAVYNNASLTLNGFTSSGANKYFGGTIYSDGSLTLNGTGDNFNLGSGSKLYGSSVKLNAENGDMTVYGSVTSTDGDITINGDDIEIIGKLTAATQGDQTTIAGISSKPASMDATGLNDPDESMQSITDRFAYTTDAANNDGNITITASGTAEVLYGHLGTGSVNIGANAAFTVNGNDSVYVDTDLLYTKGKISLTSTEGEVLLDITNTANAHITSTDATGKEALHQFLIDHQNADTGIKISGADDNEKITIDMWSSNNTFDLDKYNNTETLVDALNNLYVNGAKNVGAQYTYIWISNAEQLQGIQEYKKDNAGTGILGYNFALKNDIDASHLTDYKAIASGKDEAFTGTFDGRDNRIIGLTVGENDANNTVSSAGIFGTIGTGGAVEDLRIYSSNFYGKDYAGAVAGINNGGTITGITTLGNHIEVFGSYQSLPLHNTTGPNTVKVGAAGGIAGINYGSISDIFASDSVIAGDSGTGDSSILATAGGIAGVNEGRIDDVTADSAITANEDTTYSLGGIAGVNRNNDNNNGTISNAYNTGVVHGEYGDGNITSNSVGGIAGVNTGSISNVYNSADITGGNYVGGIVGYNYDKGTLDAEQNKISGQISNAVNAGDILADFIDKKTNDNYKYTGGLAGYNSGSISSGRNTGEIYGGDNVGGMVGGNAAGSTLTNLSNSVFAAITGESYVGGIAGQNFGNINATDSSINNYGKVYGQHYVGGIAGANEEGGTIENTISSISLYVKNENSDTDAATFFGGVAGQNRGIINGATNESSVDVAAAGATYVGGIIGQNTATGTLQGEIANAGTVSGLANVGGIIGENKNASILNNSDSNERLQITNSGNVSATQGGAAGIFYKNNITDNEGDINANAINNADITNTGTVTGGTDENSVTGGLFGYNSGNITNSTLTNSGIVTGGGTVGGLIGENTGNISTSSLKNEAGATVIGINNVGGLIGKNTGTIEGGRDDKNSYYKYQIYNNGVINVGTWADKDNDGVVDAGEIGALTDTVTSTNIGGLIGSNADETANGGKKGSLTAGYNTGAINAGSSTNVGGIVGNNAGTVDQVFNTIFNSDGTNGTITGGTNVGGIVGNNSDTGTLSNAYNTTKVVGADTVGNVVGLNDTNGTITNIYATNTSGSLIGGNTNNTQDAIKNAYSFVKGDNSATKVIDIEKQKQSDSYTGFVFDAADGAVIWKNYDSNGTPILKVFLTNASYSGDNSFVYNGQQQGVNVGNISAADSLSAYKNANELLQNLLNKDAGLYTLYSQQIAASDEGAFNPNNLGYDIDFSYKIDKATLSIILDAISRVYGNSAISNGTYGYEFDITLTELTDEMKNELAGLGFEVKGDGAVDNKGNGRTTNDADEYTWSAEFTLNDDLAKNYQFDSDGATTLKLDNGVSTVEKASLIINVGNIETTYGTAFDESQYSHRFEGITNGDTEDVINGLLNGKYTNDAAKDGIDGVWTVNADIYEGVVGLDHSELKNYDVTVKKGNATVEKAEISIGADNVHINLGQNTNYTGTDINDVLVNGDKFTNDYHYGVEDSAIENTVGTHVDSIGIWIGNSFYELSEESHWTGSGMDAFFSNYNITFTPGTLTVGEKVEPDYNWDYLYNDNPFDRLKNFRERKAEINFVDGGMEI